MKEIIVVLGEAFLDKDIEGFVARLAPDAPVPVLEEIRTLARPGGAGHAAVWVANDAPGADVVLVTALAADESGMQLKSLLESQRVTVRDLGWNGPTIEKIRLKGNGQSMLRLDRGRLDGGVLAPERVAESLGEASALLISDYGRGLVRNDTIRQAIIKEVDRIPVVWDPHPRSGGPVQGTALVTPNLRELEHFHGQPLASETEAVRTAAEGLRLRWESAAVAVTLSERGALVVAPSGSWLAPAPVVRCIDPCGAGDRFAASATVNLTRDHNLRRAIEVAVYEAARYVASDPALRAAVSSVGRIPDDEASVLASMRTVQARGLRVVATSGCFDVLHLGHTRFLEEARGRGDMLVILLNSDDSVRRLKGKNRPVNTASDRAAVLRSLSVVDAVVVFDEDTPAAVLRRLRPDVFVKGGDYRAEALPEYSTVREIGAAIEILRYWPGYSTTKVLAAAKQ